MERFFLAKIPKDFLSQNRWKMHNQLGYYSHGIKKYMHFINWEKKQNMIKNKTFKVQSQ